jgi:hypothetical protein
MVPDDLTVGRIKEWYSVASEIELAVSNSLAVPLSLRQNALWSQGQLLCLDDPENPAIDAQGVVGWAVCSFVFCNRTIFVRMNRRKGHDIPTGRFQLGIDEALPRKPLGIVFRRLHNLFMRGSRALYPAGEAIQPPESAVSGTPTNDVCLFVVLPPGVSVLRPIAVVPNP